MDVGTSNDEPESLGASAPVVGYTLSDCLCAAGLRRPGRDRTGARPERAVDGKDRGCRQASERDRSANLERAWFVAVNQAVDASRNRRTAHQAVDLVDWSGLAIDRQFPAGIVNVREDDDSRGLEVRFELDALGDWVRNLDRLGWNEETFRSEMPSARVCLSFSIQTSCRGSNAVRVESCQMRSSLYRISCMGPPCWSLVSPSRSGRGRES